MIRFKGEAMPKTLYEQMDKTSLNALACMLGFAGIQDPQNYKGWAGYRNKLRDIAALPEGFTMGDAMRAYLSTFEG
jgi:hypothetical protein